MIASLRSLCLGATVIGAALSCVSAAGAGPREDRQFFDQVQGRWTGPGEIIAGKYKGTKFNCEIDGASGQVKPGMSLDGTCRIGVFTEKVSASVELQRGNYRGSFLDGAKGKGLDVIAGSVFDDGKVVLSLNRKQLNGSMIARMKGSDQMVVTVSVKVEGRMVPVLGMNLKRADAATVSASRAD